MATSNVTNLGISDKAAHEHMGWEAWTVLVVLLITLVTLFMEKGTPDQVMLAALVTVWNLGIIDTHQALGGFGNSGLITVGALFIVVQGVDRSRIVDYICRRLLGRKSTESEARFRLCMAGFVFSGFLNNTPLVALLMPIVRDWARSRGYAASKFLMPLSYATIMGGLLTIIGTSTNLLVLGLMEQAGEEPFGFFAPGYVAFPIGIIGLLYLLLVAHRVLPERSGLFREMMERGDALVTPIELQADFPMLGCRVFEVLSHLGVQHQSLLKILRPRAAASSPLVPEGEVFGRASDGGPGEGHANPNEDQDLEEAVEMAVPPEESFPGLFSSPVPTDNVSVPTNVLSKTAPAPVCTTPKSVPVTVLGNRPSESPWRRQFSDSPRISSLAAARKEQKEDALRSQPTPEDTFLNVRNIQLAIERGLSDPNVTSIYPVPEHEVLQAWDVLFLAMNPQDLIGMVSQFKKGLTIQNLPNIDMLGPDSEFVEGVLSNDSPIVGTDVNKGAENFEKLYNVGMIAMRRRNEQQCFAAGDTVLVLAPIAAKLPKTDFLLITKVGHLPKPATWYDFVPLFLFLVGLGLAASGITSMTNVSVTLAVLTVLGGWVQAYEIQSAVDWHLLILIGSALGTAQAVQSSGLSSASAAAVKDSGLPVWGAIALLYLVVMTTTELITNNAAAALGFPLALDLTKQLGLSSSRAMTMTVMLAASTSYASPIGYATNLMVWGPGGYKFMDFVKCGLMMDLIWLVGSTILVPLVWGL